MHDETATRKECAQAMREIANNLDQGMSFADLAPALRELQSAIDMVLAESSIEKRDENL